MSLTSQTCKNYFQQAEIIAHEQIAEATWRVRVDCPNLAMTSRPGQFAMVRVKDRSDIRRVQSTSGTRPLAADASCT
jgi:NAD(P)H-flavin reductase